MLQELEPEPFVLMRSLNDARKISKEDLSLVHKLGVADVGPQSREGIVSNLGEGPSQLKVEVLPLLTAASKVDLPALGKPMKPTSAIIFSLSSSSFFSPSVPKRLTSRPFFYKALMIPSYCEVPIAS